MCFDVIVNYIQDIQLNWFRCIYFATKILRLNRLILKGMMYAVNRVMCFVAVLKCMFLSQSSDHMIAKLRKSHYRYYTMNNLISKGIFISVIHFAVWYNQVTQKRWLNIYFVISNSILSKRRLTIISFHWPKSEQQCFVIESVWQLWNASRD